MTLRFTVTGRATPSVHPATGQKFLDTSDKHLTYLVARDAAAGVGELAEDLKHAPNAKIQLPSLKDGTPTGRVVPLADWVANPRALLGQPEAPAEPQPEAEHDDEQA